VPVVRLKGRSHRARVHASVVIEIVESNDDVHSMHRRALICA